MVAQASVSTDAKRTYFAVARGSGSQAAVKCTYDAVGVTDAKKRLANLMQIESLNELTEYEIYEVVESVNTKMTQYCPVASKAGNYITTEVVSPKVESSVNKIEEKLYKPYDKVKI